MEGYTGVSSSHQMVVCLSCGANVSTQYRHLHDKWHKNIETVAEIIGQMGVNATVKDLQDLERRLAK